MNTVPVEESSPLVCVTQGSGVTIQGFLLKKLEDGKAMVQVGDTFHSGTLISRVH